MRKEITVLALGLAAGLIIAGGVILLGWAVGPTLLKLGSLILMGLTLAYLMIPLVKFFEHRLPRGSSAACAMLCGLVVVILLIVLGVPSFSRQIRQLMENLPQYQEALERFIAQIEGRLTSMGIGGSVMLKFSGQLSGWFDSLLSMLGGWAFSIPGFIARFVIVVLLSFYFLKDRDFFLDRLSMLIPSKHRPAANEAAAAVRDVLRSYVRGALTVSTITGALTGAACAILGIPGYLVLGASMAVFDLIPYIGPLIGSVPIAVLAAGSGIGKLIAAVAAIVIIQQFEAIVLSPRIVGRRSGLHPAFVVLALFAGGEWIGIAGMLFAVPIVVSLRAVARSLLHRRLYAEKNETNLS